jgi:hypothetical protein
MVGNIQPAAPAAGAPPPDPEAAQWAALEKELGEPEGIEPEVKPEPPAEPPQEPAATPLKAPTVEEHRNVQTALRQARERERQANERLNGVTQLIEQLRSGRTQEPPQPAKKEPTVEEDPIGYFQNELAKRDQVIQQLQQGTQKSVQQVQATQQENAFWGHVERSEQEMRKTATDYDDACRHLEAGRVAELKVILPDDSPQAQAYAAQHGLTPEQLRAHLLNQDRIAVAQQAIQLGVSPAQMYYNLAKQRGYAAAPGKKGGAVVQIEAARKGLKASKSISGGDGGKPDNPFNVNDLIDLYADDPEAFDKEWDKMAKAGKLG